MRLGMRIWCSLHKCSVDLKELELIMLFESQANSSVSLILIILWGLF